MSSERLYDQIRYEEARNRLQLVENERLREALKEIATARPVMLAEELRKMAKAALDAG